MSETTYPILPVPWFITLFRCVVVASGLVCIVLSFVVAGNEREFLVALLGTLCLVVVSLPLFVWRDYNLFEPMTLVILLVLFGTPFRLIYALAFWKSDPHVASHVLFNQQPEILLYGLLITIVGLICFVFGYMLRLPAMPLRFVMLPQIEEWNGRKLQLVLIMLGAVSLICFVGFVVFAGVNFNSLSELSEKRFGDARDAGSSRIMSAKYYLYRGAALCKFIVYFSLIWLFYKRKPLYSWMGIVLIAFFAQAMLLGFVLNSRSGIVLILVDCFILYFFLKETVSVRFVVICLLIVSFLTIPMLAARSGNRDSGNRNESPINEIVKKSLTGRNMLDIAKTCHIINGVPDKMNFRNGEMLYAWMAAPIPKSIWANKPVWANQGVYLNNRIFGYQGDISGVPPGLIAELYWDFGKFGVWIGLFVMGLFLRQLFLSFYAHRSNPTCILLYTLFVTRFALFSLGNDLGTGIVKAGLDLVPVYLLLLFIGMVRVRLQPVENETDLVEELKIAPSEMEPA